MAAYKDPLGSNATTAHDITHTVSDIKEMDEPQSHGPFSEGQILKIDETVDVGAAYAQQILDDPYSRKEEVKLRWRLDRRILPILMFNVILASVDKTSTSTGAL